MKKISLSVWGFINSLATLLYIIGVAGIIINGDKIFGEMGGFLGPVAFLLLFVFSALVTGLLVLGRPAFLFLNKKKKEGMKLLFMTTGWLLIFTVLSFLLVLFS